MATWFTGPGAGKNRLLTGDWDADTHTIVVHCIDSADWTPDFAADADLDDIDAGGIVASSGNLTPTVTGNVVDVDDFSITGVTGDQFERLLVTLRVGAGNSNQYLLYTVDDPDEGELPMTPNGNDIDFTVHASGLFAL